MKRCLVVGDLFIPADLMREGLAPLEESGYSIETATFDVGDYDALQGVCRRIERMGPESVPLDESLSAAMAGADIIVVHFCPVARRVFESNPALRLVGTCRTGVSNIDGESAAAAGVSVVNCRGRLADAVADFTVGLMICEARNIARGHEALKRGEWRRRYSNLGNIPDLPGRRAGLVGLGSIGRAVARRLSGFDMELIAADPYVDQESVASLGVRLLPLDQVLEAADFVSVHVDLRPETVNLIDRRRIGLMKPHAYFINTSRADVVDEDALIEALESRRIAGAALDVYRREPPAPDHPLLRLDNVTLTPHMSGGSDDAFRRSPYLLCNLILRELGVGKA